MTINSGKASKTCLSALASRTVLLADESLYIRVSNSNTRLV